MRMKRECNILLCAQLADQSRKHFRHVAYQTVVGITENGSVGIVIDGDNLFGSGDGGSVLYLSADSAGDV